MYSCPRVCGLHTPGKRQQTHFRIILEQFLKHGQEIEMITNTLILLGTWAKIEMLHEYPGTRYLRTETLKLSRGNSLSDELHFSSVLGDTRAYLYSPYWG